MASAVTEEWEAALNIRRTWAANLVRCELSCEKTPLQLFEFFDAPDDLPNPELFYYYACAELLELTRDYRDAGEHIALIAELFGLLKAEGLKRDERDPRYVKGDSYAADLAEYARKHEGQLRFWWLVGRLDADGLFGSEKPGLGVMPLLVHGAQVLLRALEDPVNRKVVGGGVAKAGSLQDKALLRYYAAEWDRYMTGANYLDRLFTYLNRYWAKRERDEGVYQIYTKRLDASPWFRPMAMRALCLTDTSATRGVHVHDTYLHAVSSTFVSRSRGSAQADESPPSCVSDDSNRW
ncbi:hypothetical protein B0H19DRAFT_1260652 [Mycena capillaripes]|nr:hypothetical protein B0H19DRAFT_1260652 [Mycena capillaripes]